MKARKKISGGRRALQAPLWLQSFYSFLRVMLIVGIIIAFPLVLTSIAEGDYGDLPQQLKFFGNIFLVSLGVPLHIFRTQPASGSENMAGFTGFGGETEVPSEVQGNFSLIPLMMIIIVVFLSRRSGYLLARTALGNRIWQVLCGWFVSVLGATALASWLSETETVRASFGAFVAVPLLPTGFGLWWGMKMRKGYWLRLPKVLRKEEKAKERERGIALFLKSAVRSSAASLLLMLCMSAAVLTVGFCLKWADIAHSFQLLDADWAGDLEFFIVQAMYLPNVIIMTASWLSGAGVYLGNTALMTPSGAGDTVAVLIPVLQAVPEDLGWFGFAVPAVFVLAGFTVGQWFWLHAENYVDEAFDMFFNKRFISLALSGIVNASVIAGFTAAAMLTAGWLGGGELGYPGSYYGAHLPWFGVCGAATLGGGIFIGQMATALMEHYQLRSGKIGSGPLARSKKQNVFSAKEIQ